MNDGGKLDQMQITLNGFLNEFNSGDQDVRFSLVPFSQYVNVGIDNGFRSWIDNSQEGTRFPPDEQDLYEHEDCPVAREQRTSIRNNDGVETETTDWVCPVERESTHIGTNIVEPLKTWDGCVGSRAGNLAAQSPFNGTRFPAVYDDGGASRTRYRRTDYDCPNVAAIRLTDNLSTVQTLIGDLEGSGNTYMPSGLAWGWRTLHDTRPFGREIAGQTRKRVLIMMTDGFNTVSRRDADPQMKPIC